MDFEELLRRGDQLQAASIESARAKSIAAERGVAELEDWRNSLVAFGEWFAHEATARHISTRSLVHELPGERLAPAAPRARGWLGKKQQVAAGARHVVENRRGWAVLPLADDGALWRAPQSVKYGGRKNFDQMVDQKDAWMCLAVDTHGRVVVGLELQEPIILLSWGRPGLVSDGAARFVGMEVDQLTPGILMHNVAQMAAYVPPSDGSETSRQIDELRTATAAQNEVLRSQILTRYVAGAKHSFGRR